MKILALDLGTNTGWATFNTETQVTKSGTVKLFSAKEKMEDRAKRFIRLNEFLCDIDDGFGEPEVELVVYEMPHQRGGPATFVLVGLAATVETWCIRHKAKHERVHSATIKKFMTGDGKADKDAVMTAVQKRIGRWPEDDNEGDALAILFWTLEKEKK